MEIYFLRHAEAVQRGSPDYPEDSGRPLNPEGEKRMYRVAKGMRKLGLSFDLILSSPFVRAQRTAEIAAEILKLKTRLEFTAHLEVNGSPEKLIAEINRNHQDAKSILLVGHEPYLSSLVSRLLTGDSNLALNFKKAGLAKLATDTLQFDRCAVLDWFMTPRQLERVS
ncbi:MAG: phosphohistidine phosphatase SixA [Candidatus Omnitrophica bacterium]|nr:phosphohistidine phosphatase SixA [Candidatus Omnitrophota bacterium]